MATLALPHRQHLFIRLPLLLRNAELALNHARLGGGNRFSFYDVLMARNAEHRNQLENDLRLAGNLILEFPGSTATEVEETLAALAAALPFPPLEPATFFLGQGCPVDKAPQAFGLTAVTCHANYRALYPATLLNRVPMLVRSGRGDRERGSGGRGGRR